MVVVFVFGFYMVFYMKYNAMLLVVVPFKIAAVIHGHIRNTLKK